MKVLLRVPQLVSVNKNSVDLDRETWKLKKAKEIDKKELSSITSNMTSLPLRNMGEIMDLNVKDFQTTSL